MNWLAKMFSITPREEPVRHFHDKGRRETWKREWDWRRIEVWENWQWGGPSVFDWFLCRMTTADDCYGNKRVLGRTLEWGHSATGADAIRMALIAAYEIDGTVFQDADWVRQEETRKLIKERQKCPA